MQQLALLHCLEVLQFKQLCREGQSDVFWAGRNLVIACAEQRCDGIDLLCQVWSQLDYMYISTGRIHQDWYFTAGKAVMQLKGIAANSQREGQVKTKNRGLADFCTWSLRATLNAVRQCVLNCLTIQLSLHEQCQDFVSCKHAVHDHSC